MKIIFFYNNIKNEIYIKSFRDYENQRNFSLIYKLRKILYDLKQSFYV